MLLVDVFIAFTLLEVEFLPLCSLVSQMHLRTLLSIVS